MTCLALITSTSGLLPRQPVGREKNQALENEALNVAWMDRRLTQGTRPPHSHTAHHTVTAYLHVLILSHSHTPILNLFFHVSFTLLISIYAILLYTLWYILALSLSNTFALFTHPGMTILPLPPSPTIHHLTYPLPPPSPPSLSSHSPFPHSNDRFASFGHSLTRLWIYLL